MDNVTQYYILDENNQEIDMALDPIYLIHSFIRAYGLNNLQIIQQEKDTNVTAHLIANGNLHDDKLSYYDTECIYLQEIKCDNISYKLVAYIVPINFNNSDEEVTK